MNIVYVPVKKNVLNLYLKIKNLLNKFICEYAILFKDTTAIIPEGKKIILVVFVLFNFFGTNRTFLYAFCF